MAGAATPARDVISFGPFSLVVSERLLTREGVAVELGARTLDTLIALVSRPNEIVGKRELLAEVWPDVIVEEGSLRFHIASLRKALGDGEEGARYISTLAGRGYCFVAPVVRTTDRAPVEAKPAAPVPGANYVPARLMRMVGREDGVEMLSEALRASRFVTIVGAGGIGKTTVAIAVTHALRDAFDGAVVFHDLGMQSDPALVAPALASMLGLAVLSGDPVGSLTAYLRDKRLLLVLDNCEHLIDAAADLAAGIFADAPDIHILATSREALRVEGEQVHRLAPLAFPPEDTELTAAEALSFPATQLFVERAAASGVHLELTDADAPIVAEICRKLDGVALAIELAAGRVQAYGLNQTAALLDQRLSLTWQGRRTAPARQQTLQATLGWSYELLSELERSVFRRLAVFVGTFTIEAAAAIVAGADADPAPVFGAIDSLVAKSMVATRQIGAAMRYRLLATNRAYALEIGDAAERAEVSRRHAAYYCRWLEQTGGDWQGLSTAVERAPHLAALANARLALEWCFGTDGDVEIGIDLAAAAAPVLLAMSLLTECHRWSERALRALGETGRAGREEMRLQAALGLSSMFTHGQSEPARAALNRSLAIAEQLGDASNQLQLLGILHMFCLRIGDLKTALDYARRSAAVASSVADPAASALSHSLLGLSLHLAGDLGNARAELEAALRQGPNRPRVGTGATASLGFDGYNIAGAALARTLWLQGYPDQARERARRAVQDAAGADHPVTLSIALIWAVSVFFATGDLDMAEQHVDWFIARAEFSSLTPYLAVGRGFKGQLALARGDAAGGVELLRGAREELRAARYELVTTAFGISLVQGLAAVGRGAEGLALMDETIRLVETNGDVSYMPELLRVKGGILLSMPQPDLGGAQDCLGRSLEWSRRQAAPAWELRTAVDLAGLWAAQGRVEDARSLLRPVFAQFVEGADTADLKAAGRLLASLG
jgi:predicted ATPase/DNA-binding winged helix-turn-helix (wHTH) protein